MNFSLDFLKNEFIMDCILESDGDDTIIWIAGALGIVLLLCLCY